MTAVTEADIISWIKQSLEHEDLTNVEINFTGKKDKDDGYSSEIVFVNVKGTAKDNKKKVLDLAVKHGKSNEHLRQQLPMMKIFETEMHFYDKVVPAFRKFQEEKNISNVFSPITKCYLTLKLENMEVLVMENLRTLGYKMHDRTKPFNFDHISLLLKEYGKLHALSFALKDQNREQFNSIVNCQRIFETLFDDKGMKDTFQNNCVEALNMLQERGDENLHNKLKKVLEKNVIDIILGLMAEEEPQSVIIHADCWNNNFLFKYEGDDTTSPSTVKILDWQISALRSPGFDLGFVIYCNCSKEVLDKFEELLEIYYTSLSSFLLELESNPEEIFTYADLKRHWRRCSIFGVIFLPTALKAVLCKKEDAPDLANFKEGQNLASFMTPDIGDEDAFYERLKAVVTHYFEYTLAK